MRIVRPLLTLIGALTVIGLLIMAVLFIFAPQLLQNEDNLQTADAIVVLGGNYYRPIYAAELYNKGFAPKLFVSKPVVLPEEMKVRDLEIGYLYQWEVMRDILIKNGISADKFSFFGQANVSTIEEAEELNKALTSDIKSLILVTSPLHTRRAGIIFREILPKDVRIYVVSTPYDIVPTQWWTNFRAAPFVVLEVAKTLYYELGGGFRSSNQILH